MFFEVMNYCADIFRVRRHPVSLTRYPVCKCTYIVLKCISKLEDKVNRHRPKRNRTLFTSHRAKFLAWIRAISFYYNSYLIESIQEAKR